MSISRAKGLMGGLGGLRRCRQDVTFRSGDIVLYFETYKTLRTIHDVTQALNSISCHQKFRYELQPTHSQSTYTF